MGSTFYPKIRNREQGRVLSRGGYSRKNLCDTRVITILVVGRLLYRLAHVFTASLKIY